MYFILNNKYIKRKVLEKGDKWQVYLCQCDENGKQEQVVVKEIFDTAEFGSENMNLEKEIEVFQHLIACQKETKVNQNVLKCYEIFQEGQSYYIVSEYCNSRRLNQNISQFHQYYQISTIIRMGKQIINGINYLHQVGITHRSLKPESILISLDKRDYQLKITDFGSYSLQNTKSPFGEINYMAPEILNLCSYKQAVDIWSFGCIMYELMYGRMLFPQKNSSVVARAIKQFRKYNQTEDRPIYKELNSLIAKCLAVEPSKRPTSDTILAEFDNIDSLYKQNKGQQEYEEENLFENTENPENVENREQEVVSQYEKQVQNVSLLDWLLSWESKLGESMSDEEIEDLKKRNQKEIVSVEDVIAYNMNPSTTTTPKSIQQDQRVLTAIILLHILIQNCLQDFQSLFNQLGGNLLFTSKQQSQFFHFLILCQMEESEIIKIDKFFECMRNEIFQQIIEKLSKDISKYQNQHMNDDIIAVQKKVSKYNKDQFFFTRNMLTDCYIYFLSSLHSLIYQQVLKYSPKFTQSKVLSIQKKKERLWSILTTNPFSFIQEKLFALIFYFFTLGKQKNGMTELLLYQSHKKHVLNPFQLIFIWMKLVFKTILYTLFVFTLGMLLDLLFFILGMIIFVFELFNLTRKYIIQLKIFVLKKFSITD